MSIDFMNMFYENSMIMKHEFHCFPIYGPIQPKVPETLLDSHPIHAR